MATSPPHGSVQVRLNAMKNASLFWASEECSQFMSENAKRLLELEKRLALKFRNTRTDFTAGRTDGEYVAVKSVEDDSKWYRGRIIHSHHHLTGIKYQVDLIDYGTQVRAKPQHLRTLPKNELEALPPLAFLLQLYGILPVSLDVDYVKDKMMSIITNQWTPQAEKFANDILKLCHEVFFVEKRPILFGSSSLKIKYGDLLFRDREAQDLVSLSDLLCSKNLGTRNEEEFMRRQEQLHCISADVPELCVAQCSDYPANRNSTRNASTDLSKQSRDPIPLMTDYVADKEAKNKEQSSPTVQGNAASCNPVNKIDDSSVSKGSDQTDGNQTPDSSASENSKVKPNRLSNLLRIMNKAVPPVTSACNPKDNDGSPSPNASAVPRCSLDKAIESSAPKAKAPQGRRTVPETQRINFIPAGRSVPDSQKGRDGSRNNKTFGSVMEDISTNCMKKKQHASESDRSESESSYSSRSWNSDEPESEKARTGSYSGRSMSRKETAETSKQSVGRMTNVTVLSPVTASQDKATLSSSARSIQQNVASGLNFPCLGMSGVTGEENYGSQQYLEKNVLLHGGLAPTPWMSPNDFKSKFSLHFETVVTNRKWSASIFTLEKFMWPAILSRQNVVMVAGPQSGKTSSYLIPILDSLLGIEEIPKGNGPLFLILCGGCKAAQGVYEECFKLTPRSERKLRIRLAYGLVLDEDFMINMINGCEILVTTPSCLLRIIERVDVVTNLRRVCHIVLDQAEILFTKFLSQMRNVQALVVNEQVRRKDSGDPIQIVVSSEKWVPNLLHFTSHLRSNPIVCIIEPLEAVVYGRAIIKLHAVHSEKKPADLIDLLQKHVDLAMMRTVVICYSGEEVNLLEKFLTNACIDCLVLRPSDSTLHVETCLESFKSTNTGRHYVLVCTDHELSSEFVNDAMCLIHFSLTKDKTSFVKRFSVVVKNLKDMFNTSANYVAPVIHIYADETNVEQLPVIVQLMQRLGEEVDETILKRAKYASRYKEETRRNKPLCIHVKMFGDCWDKTSCPNRHVLVSDLDSPVNLPNCGDVTMQILAVHNACHFSVRILEHTNEKTIPKKWPSNYVRIASMMSVYFSSTVNKQMQSEVNVGDICALETAENLFQRVLVLEIVEINQHKRPITVKIQFLDEGCVQNVKVLMLYFLPDSLKCMPPEAIDLFVCRLLPCDNDDSWNEITNSCVRQWVKTTENDYENSKVFSGQIVFSLRGALWVDPLNIMKRLPHTGVYVNVRNIRRSLLQDQHACDNQAHLQKLYALCAGQDSFILPPIARKERTVVTRPRPQPKPMWAFLDTDNFSSVIFSSADDVNCFFVRKRASETLLQRLLRDIGNEIEKSKNKEIPVVEPGSICLARHSSEGVWHRAQVLSKINENTVSVFYVDYGDRDDLGYQEITSIPDWAILQLPFQAIECSLAGISSCDSIDLLYDATDDGAKPLQAKVCEKITAADCTGGRHYIVAIVDCSSASPSLLNTNLLSQDGVKPQEDQLEFLKFDLKECCTAFETSEDESCDSNSDQEDSPVSESCNTRDNFGFSKEDLAEEEIVIGDHKVNFDDFDYEDVEYLVMNDNALDKFKPIFNYISCQRSLEGLPQMRAIEQSSHTPDMHGPDRPCAQQNNHTNEQPREEPCQAAIPLLSAARPPQVKWSEDLYHVRMKICITGVARYFLRWNAYHIQFSTSVNGRHYCIHQRLRGIIYPKQLTSSTNGFFVLIKLRKACSGVFWGELFASERKYGWVALDHDGQAESSDDSDDEVHPTIDAFNRRVKKLPIKQRRQRRRPQDGPALPCNDSENDSDSEGDGYPMDPDMF